MFQVSGTVDSFLALAIIRLISHWAFRTITALSVLVFRSWAVSFTFNFFKLQNVHECYSSHMCIVCSLMVVRKCSLPLIVGTMVFLVKSTFQIVLELVVISAFFHDLIQAGKVKRFWRCCQSFCIICVRESWVPFLHELQVCFWEWSNKLVVEVKPIVHAVVSNDRLLCVYHGFYDEREAHLVNEELFLWIFRVDHLLDTVGSCWLWLLRGTFILRSSRFIERWPIKLFSSNNVQVKIVDSLMSVFAVICDDLESLI